MQLVESNIIHTLVRPNLLYMLNKAEIENSGVELKFHGMTWPERVIPPKNKLHLIKRA